MKNYVVKLYVSGNTKSSIRAVRNLNRIAKEYLNDTWSIEIVDIQENPETAVNEKIIATPTLIRTYPPPARKIIGDLSDTESVIVWLGAQPRNKVFYNNTGGK